MQPGPEVGESEKELEDIKEAHQDGAFPKMLESECVIRAIRVQESISHKVK